MNQYKAIYQIREMLQNLITEYADSDSQLTQKLKTIDQELNYFLNRGIDFKQIVDELDDSIFITDKEGNVLYVNPAYTRNTGITPDRVLNHNVHDLIEKDKLYSGGAIPDVLRTKKSAFRLSTTYGTGAPLLGYASGTPVFDSDGNLHQVIASSRPIVTLQALKEDFNTFVRQVQEMNPQNTNTESEKHLSTEMIGKDGTLANIWTLISHVAPSDATVLITGESGAGKEVIADEIYRNSKRNDKPFVKINCAAIPAHLLESELFGYEKGAFSGANAKGKPGLFEMANHGTLMLDEIGDMPMDLQVKLLSIRRKPKPSVITSSTPFTSTASSGRSRFLGCTFCFSSFAICSRFSRINAIISSFFKVEIFSIPRPCAICFSSSLVLRSSLTPSCIYLLSFYYILPTLYFK